MRQARATVHFPDGAKAHLATIVASLRRPASYPDAVSRVDAIETHMSWVFLTDAHAWKLKKPVRTALFDVTKLEARRLACETEVALNRRLAPDVYLGVVPVVSAGDAVRVGGTGEPVEWLVKMHRLPRDRMLDRCIGHRNVSSADIGRIAATLSRFYTGAERVPVDGHVYRESIVSDIALKCASLERPRYALPVDDVRATGARQVRWLERHDALIEARGARVVDAHGDLRPEHICLVEPEPVVIDCLEFSRALRLLDPLSELSYLALECRRLGDTSVGQRLLAAWVRQVGEPAPAGLFTFYQSHHALIRAAVAVWHLDDDALDRSDGWRERAKWYLRAAGEVP